MSATVTIQQVEDRVREALVELGPEPEQITPDATLESLDIDSLDLVELGQVLQQEFGFEVKPEDFEGVVTVGDALDVIKGYLA